MERKWVVLGSCTSLLVLIATAHLYEEEIERTDRQATAMLQSPPPKPETRMPSVADIMDAYLPGMEDGTPDLRAAAVRHLLEEFGSKDHEATRFSVKEGESLAQALAGAMTSEGVADDGLKARIVRFVAGRTRGLTSTALVEKVFDEGPQSLRLAALDGVGRPGGVRGRAIYEKVLALRAQGDVPDLVAPEVYQRIGGKEGAEAILALMRSTQTPQVIARCAVALQNYHDAGLFAAVMDRLAESGMLEGKGQLPWIDRKALVSYMEIVDEVGLAQGIKLLRSRPSLVRENLAAVGRALENPEPGLRAIAAEAIEKAVAGRYLPAAKGRELLAGRLERETEPALRAQMASVMDLTRELLEVETPAAVP